MQLKRAKPGKVRFKTVLFLVLSFFSTVGFAQPSNPKIADLPISANLKGTNKTLLFYLTGDGGMNSFSNKLIESLVAQNYKIITLDSKKYFWDSKSPESMGRELSIALDYYIKQSNTSTFAILGYSFGADAAIVLASNLSKPLNEKLSGLVVMSPSMATDLEVKVSDLIGFGAKTVGKYKTLPLAKKLNKPFFCIAGADEDNLFYNDLHVSKIVNKKTLSGAHKYDNNLPVLTKTILSALASF